MRTLWLAMLLSGCGGRLFVSGERKIVVASTVGDQGGVFLGRIQQALEGFEVRTGSDDFRAIFVRTQIDCQGAVWRGSPFVRCYADVLLSDAKGRRLQALTLDAAAPSANEAAAKLAESTAGYLRRH